MKLAYIIAIVTVLLNKSFGTYFKKSSEIKEESPSTKLFQRHKLDENLIQTNKSDSELNGSETRHLVIVKLPKGKDNKYIDHLNDRIFPIFPKDVSNSNAGHIFDGATDKRCADDVIKNNDTILDLRGKPVSLPGGNSEASKKANLNQKSVGDSYNKAKITKYAHVFKRPGSYNDRPTLFNRPELIVKLDQPKKPSKIVSEIYQSPLGVYQRWKPTTGLYERPQSPFGDGYKDRKKGYEKPPGILVTDYRRPILFNRGRHTVNPLKVIPNKDVGFESNPGYYPSSPFNDRFSSARIFGKTNKQYNFPKVLISSKTGENLFEPKLELKKKYITPIIGRNEGINKGLVILTSLLNKAKGDGINENKDVTQKPVSYRRNKEQNIDNNGSKRIDLLKKNYSDEVLFTDPDLESKNSSSKVIGLDNTESDLFEGANDKKNELLEGMNNKKNDLVDGVNDKESDLVEGMGDKENNSVEGMNDIETDLVEGMNDEKNILVDGVNNKESDIVERIDDKENNPVEGMNDIETDLVEGMNDEKNNLVDGVNNKESDIVQRMDDKENNPVEGMNDIETDLVEGMNDEKNNLVDGVNDKESDIVKGKISKESNLSLQTKLEEVLSKNQVNDEALLKKSLNHTSNEQSMFIKLKENERAFISSAEISTNVMDGEIKPSAINEINSLNNEETTTFNYIDKNINDKGNYGKLCDNCRNTTTLSSNNNKDNRPIINVMINTRNYSEKEDKNKNLFSKNESMSQLPNISPPDLGDYTETNESNIVSDFVKHYDESVATTPLPFLEISIPKAIHESLLNEHNLMHTTDRSFVGISKNSADSNISNIFSDDHKYESKETNARNEESRSDYLSYSTTINKEDPLPSIFNYSRELPKVVLAPEIIDYPPHELVEGQFVKLQPELFGRSDSESYLDKDMHKNFKNDQMSEVHYDKLVIPEKDKREYLFEEPVQHYTSENSLNLNFNNFYPKNELSDTYLDYEDDLGKSQPPVLSSIMEDFPSSLKSKAIDDSLILHGLNVDETAGSLDMTKGYQTRKSENINLYEASGPEPNFDSSHLESDTMSVNELKRRGSYDEFPSYEYIKLNNPGSQLKNIRREDNSVDTINYKDIARENEEDLGNRAAAQTIEDTNPSYDFYKSMEVKKMPSIYKYSKENLDLKSENDQIESVDSYASEHPQSYTESEKHIINQIFDHIKLKNDDKSEYIKNTDENNQHSIPKLINNYVYQETTGARTNTEDMPLNTESSKCLSCDYGILSESKLTKKSDEKYQIINDNSSVSPKQICIRIDDKGDIKEDMMNLLYQVLKNKTTNINNSLADKKLGDDSVENEGKDKTSANIFNLLVRHLNDVNARKQLQENYQNLLTKSKTEIDEDKLAILDLSDQSSERKETMDTIETIDQKEFNNRFFKIPNKFQRGPFSDVNQSESKEFSKGVGTMMSSNDSRELLNAISKTMRKVQQRSRPTYRNKKMCGKKKCNDFIGRRTELMKNIISSLHEYVIEDKTTT